MNKGLLKTYVGFMIITIAALYIIDSAHIAYPLEITTSQRSTELSVVGEGKVEAVPDTASVNLGITVQNAPSVESAQSQIDSANNAIISAMKGLGIEDENIQTSNYSVNPNYSYDERRQDIDGYNAQASITVKTHDLELVSQIVSQATASGANQVNGVNFSIEDPAALREEARTLAIENAKEQANKLAKELGIKLGKVTNIVESSPNSPQPFYSRAFALEDATVGAPAPEIEPGSQTITSTVTLFFEKR